MNMKYTYLIGWSDQNTWYYGARYAKDCNPEDLWKTYFTSSKYVSEFRELHGEPDVIQIRKLFDCPFKAQEWEKKVLKRMSVLYDDKWLNKNIGGRIYIKKQSEEHIRKRSQNKKIPINSKEIAIRASSIAAEKRRGTFDSEETKNKRNESLRKYHTLNKLIGKTRATSRKYLIEGVVYDGLYAVMEKFDISMPTVYNRIKNDKFDWSHYGK